jgi:hypothetical protein
MHACMYMYVYVCMYVWPSHQNGTWTLLLERGMYVCIYVCMYVCMAIAPKWHLDAPPRERYVCMYVMYVCILSCYTYQNESVGCRGTASHVLAKFWNVDCVLYVLHP